MLDLEIVITGIYLNILLYYIVGPVQIEYYGPIVSNLFNNGTAT
jgi:hypothetical protein